MNDKKIPEAIPSKPAKKSRWLRWLAGCAGGLLAVLIIAYLFLTSSFCLSHVILPKAGAAFNSQITVSGSEIHPFSNLVLRDLKVQAPGQEPVLNAKEIRLRYSLMDIIKGNIHVDEVAIDGADIQIIKDVHGASNLDPILNALKTKPQTAAKTPAGPGKPAQLDVRKVTLSNCTVALIQERTNGLRDVTQVKNVNVTLANLKNGQAATLAISALAQIEQNPDKQNQNSMETSIEGKFTIQLTPELQPGGVQGQLTCAIGKTAGSFAQADQLSAELQCQASLTQLQTTLQFKRGAAPLGTIVMSGTRNPATGTDNLSLAVQNLDKEVLNAAGAAAHVDFGTTTINTTNQVQITEAGPKISVQGQVAVARLQIIRDGQTTPTLDLNSAYDVSVDAAAKTAEIKQFTVSGTRNQMPLLDCHLTQPTTVSWGTGTAPVSGSAIDCTITGFDLADWKALAKDLNPAGVINAQIHLGYGSDKLITYSLQSTATGLTARMGTNTLPLTDIEATLQGQITNLNQIAVEKTEITVALNKAMVAKLEAQGTYGIADKEAALQIQTETDLAHLLAAFPTAGTQIQSGEIQTTLTIGQKGGNQTVAGTIELSKLTGQVGQNKLNNLATTVKLAVANSPVQAEIQQLEGTLSQNGNAAGTFSLSGTRQTTSGAVEGHLKLSGINQNLLRTFLQPALGDKELQAINIDADLTAKNNAGKTDLNGTLGITNLVVKTAQQTLPPLEAAFKLDASGGAGNATLRQFEITLTPTSRADNRIQLEGQVNFAQATNIEGNLNLTGDSLDLTAYYDLLANNKKPGNPNPATAAPPAAAPPAAQVTTTPFHHFTFKTSFAHVYLHEIDITGLLVNAAVDGSQIHLDPVQMTLNGGPVKSTADIDLSVPGYKYNVGLTADKVPLAPIANSVVAGANNKYNGTVMADVQVTGQGTTGTDLKQHLDGHVTFVLTNANIQLMANNTKVLFIPINVPLIATLLNMPEISQSPVTGVNTHIALGQGQINVHTAEVASPAFLADVQGSIPIADVLTNSPLNLPIQISLVNSLAKRFVQTNGAAYTALPVFLTVTGTIGNPQTKTDKIALAALTAQAAAAIYGGNSQAGSLIQAGGSLLQGFSGALQSKTNSPGQSNTNQPRSNLLNGLFK